MAMTGTLGDPNPGEVERRQVPRTTSEQRTSFQGCFYRRLEKCDAGVGKAIIMKQGNTRV